MVLQLKQLFDISGDLKLFEYDISLENLKQHKSYPFISPIAINGTLVNRAGVVKLDYSVKFTMKLNCDRCLNEFDREYSYNFHHLLVRSTNHDDDEYIECPDNTLDLDELAISDVLLQLPSKILCSDDCKGLCSKCGINKNTSDCGCPKE